MKINFSGSADEFERIFGRRTAVVSDTSDNDVSAVRGGRWFEFDPDASDPAEADPRCTKEQCYCNSYAGCSDYEDRPKPKAAAPITPVPPKAQPVSITPGYTGAPKSEPVPGTALAEVLTLRISDEKRQSGWEAFCTFLQAWMVNFDDAAAPQPDRIDLMKDFGSSPATVSVLVMAYEVGSLQRLVALALGLEDLDRADAIAAHLVQLSHIGFPDIQGTYDYSLAWRRVRS